MSGARQSADELIGVLAAGLRPVRPLWHPAVRASLWLGAVVALGLALLPMSDAAGLTRRLTTSADLRWTTLGALLTTIAAAIAAFQMSVPDRSVRWSWLPAGPAALWLGSSGAACLPALAGTAAPPAGFVDSLHCVAFITLVSLPLSVGLVIMLRRAHPLWPGRVAALGGLAAAAAAATLLTLFHPFDVSAIDVFMHVLAVSLVVMVTRHYGR